MGLEKKSRNGANALHPEVRLRAAVQRKNSHTVQSGNSDAGLRGDIRVRQSMDREKALRQGSSASGKSTGMAR